MVRQITLQILRQIILHVTMGNEWPVGEGMARQELTVRAQTERTLTLAEFYRLADVPLEVEWFGNLRNRHTRKATRVTLKNSWPLLACGRRRNSARSPVRMSSPGGIAWSAPRAPGPRYDASWRPCLHCLTSSLGSAILRASRSTPRILSTTLRLRIASSTAERPRSLCMTSSKRRLPIVLPPPSFLQQTPCSKQS